MKEECELFSYIIYQFISCRLCAFFSLAGCVELAPFLPMLHWERNVYTGNAVSVIWKNELFLLLCASGV